MSLSRANVSFVVLAGGLGTRLGGVAKGLIELEGEALVDRALRLAEGFAEALLVTADPAPYAGRPVRLVTSEARDAGPLSGLLAAAEAALGTHVLLLACDQPFVTAAVVDSLLETSDPTRPVCFEVGSKRQPFPSLWPVAGVRALRLGRDDLPGSTEGSARVAGHPLVRSLQGALEALEARCLPEAALARVDPDLRSVRSLNRPEDLIEVGARLPSKIAPQSP